MKHTKIKNLGQLKASGYSTKSIKDELRDNLRERLRTGQDSFEGVWGYENSVIPELERAILSRHNINLLGLRGQAKTRLARLMVELLDEWIPVVEGSEINDDPLQPMSRYALELLNEKGDEINFDHYIAIGRLNKALSQHANEAYDLMSKQDKQIAQKIFKALTTVDASGRKIRKRTDNNRKTKTIHTRQ